MKPELERGISNLPDASFKSFRLHQPAFRSHWHYHPELELVFFSQGKGMRFIGDDISLYNEGDLFLIGENLPHTFVSYQNEPEQLAEAYCIQFHKALFDSFVECHLFERLFQEAKRGIVFSKPSELVIDKIKKSVTQPGISALISLIEVLELLTDCSGRASILTQDYQRHTTFYDPSTRIQIAVDFINTHYQRLISLQEIADVCHFSPNAFCRWFKQNMSLTFIDYLNKVRLTHVCQLLISTDWPVGHIAAQSGFDNISTLNRLFQQKLHTSPSLYRLKQRL